MSSPHNQRPTGESMGDAVNPDQFPSQRGNRAGNSVPQLHYMALMYVNGGLSVPQDLMDRIGLRRNAHGACHGARRCQHHHPYARPGVGTSARRTVQHGGRGVVTGGSGTLVCGGQPTTHGNFLRSAGIGDGVADEMDNHHQMDIDVSDVPLNPTVVEDPSPSAVPVSTNPTATMIELNNLKEMSDAMADDDEGPPPGFGSRLPSMEAATEVAGVETHSTSMEAPTDQFAVGLTAQPAGTIIGLNVEVSPAAEEPPASDAPQNLPHSSCDETTCIVVQEVQDDKTSSPTPGAIFSLPSREDCAPMAAGSLNLVYPENTIEKMDLYNGGNDDDVDDGYGDEPLPDSLPPEMYMDISKDETSGKKNDASVPGTSVRTPSPTLNPEVTTDAQPPVPFVDLTETSDDEIPASADLTRMGSVTTESAVPLASAPPVGRPIVADPSSSTASQLLAADPLMAAHNRRMNWTEIASAIAQNGYRTINIMPPMPDEVSYVGALPSATVFIGYQQRRRRRARRGAADRRRASRDVPLTTGDHYSTDGHDAANYNPPTGARPLNVPPLGGGRHIPGGMRPIPPAAAAAAAAAAYAAMSFDPAWNASNSSWPHGFAYPAPPFDPTRRSSYFPGRDHPAPYGAPPFDYRAWGAAPAARPPPPHAFAYGAAAPPFDLARSSAPAARPPIDYYGRAISYFESMRRAAATMARQSPLGWQGALNAIRRRVAGTAARPPAYGSSFDDVDMLSGRAARPPFSAVRREPPAVNVLQAQRTSRFTVNNDGLQAEPSYAGDRQVEHQPGVDPNTVRRHVTRIERVSRPLYNDFYMQGTSSQNTFGIRISRQHPLTRSAAYLPSPANNTRPCEIPAVSSNENTSTGALVPSNPTADISLIAEEPGMYGDRAAPSGSDSGDSEATQSNSNALEDIEPQE